MKNLKHYRQGDVFLKEVESVPEGAEVENTKESKNRVLAYGEVTGHSHRFDPAAMQFYTFDEKRYVEIQEETALLRHEEHGEIKVPGAKTYEVIIQREYVPGGWTQVVD